MDQGLLVARIVLGLLMAAHGTQKLFGWFGGPGLSGATGFMASLGFRPARLFATAAAAGEIAGGMLLLLGLLGPVGPAIILSIMIVAAVTVHWHGVFAASNGVEVPLLYATGAVALALTGFGRYSMDAALGLQPFWTTPVVVATLAAGFVAGLINLSLRHRPVIAE